MARQSNDDGFSIIEILLVIIIVGSIVGIGLYIHRALKNENSTYDSATKISESSSPKFKRIQKKASTSVATSTDPYSGWKTYTSSEEKATFEYPSDWSIDASDAMSSNDPNNHDFTAIKSPDGQVIVRWTSEIDGFGNEYGTTYPYNDVVSKTPIKNASGDFVISGTTTLDGTAYYPWIAVANNPTDGILATGISGTLDTFLGRNNLNPTTGHHDTALFSTSGPRTNEDSPSLSQAQAIAYLSNGDMQQARLILLSLSYSQ
jgi:prepilin-type N-terminal cleavage/methylation domain-containing protein